MYRSDQATVPELGHHTPTEVVRFRAVKPYRRASEPGSRLIKPS